MKKLVLSVLTGLMKKRLLLGLLLCTCVLTVYPQAVYVDSENGDDSNPGTEAAPFHSIHKALEIVKSNANNIYTVKINPGIYILDSVLSVSTEKDMTGKRIMFEANILPDDATWTPEKMPVIITHSKKGEIPEYYHYVASFLINESHVTIRGLKFPGYFYPNTRYFPIARFNKAKADLFVEQCMFIGDDDASHLQVGVIAHGDSVKIDHCVFYNARNSVVFWEDAGSGSKTGNSLTHSIIYGASQSGVWTSWPDNDFVFKNNIVTNCKYAWIKNDGNGTIYTLDTCVIVNNQYYQGVAYYSGVVPEAFTIIENNVIKSGEISLRHKPDNVDDPLPIDYLHIIPDSLGYNLNAGLFKVNAGIYENPQNFKLIQNYPNPFHSSTMISYSISQTASVELNIYDVLGDKVRTLVKGYQSAGTYEIPFDAENLSAGVYFYKLSVDGVVSEKKKMLFLR